MEIEILEALKRSDLLFIDVRSPGEYAEASIPGAVNIPLFDDREHHQLGIIYYQLGENEARRSALTMVAPKLPALVDQIIKACQGEKKPLLYCRRGGLRSLSLYYVLTLTGVPTFRLKRGYKAFRRYVNDRLNSYLLKHKIFVLHGLTGVGKTAILEKLEKSGIPVIDLEGLACHRGSVFGAVGFDRLRSQKDFDALLLQQLDKQSNEPHLVIEGEGRRIGNVYLPSFLSSAMNEGLQLLLTASVETRVERIVNTYTPASMTAGEFGELKEALSSLRRRMGNQKVDRLLNLLDQGEYHTVAEVLCTDYYDLFYSDSRPEFSQFDVVIDATDLDSAARQIIELINRANLIPARAVPQNSDKY